MAEDDGGASRRETVEPVGVKAVICVECVDVDSFSFDSGGMEYDCFEAVGVESAGIESVGVEAVGFEDCGAGV